LQKQLDKLHSMEQLSSIIRHARQNKDYSQNYIAQLLEISQQAYSKLERHPERSSFLMVYIVLHLLEVDIQNLPPPRSTHSGSK